MLSKYTYQLPAYFGLLSLSLTPAWAQSQTPITSSNVDSSTDIQELVVTSARTPIPLEESLLTTHVITQEQLALTGPRDLGSALGRVSGVDFADSGGRGSVNGVFVRGNATGATLILIDGVRSASATTGATDLNNIPVEHIEQIEIVTGPTSSLYGADAVGGVINVITKQPSAEGFNGSANISLGSNSLQEYGVSTSFGTEKNQFGLNINYEDTDGIDRTLSQADGNGDDDGYEQLNVGLTGNLTLTDSFSARLAYLYSDSTAEFDNTFGADTGFFSDTELQKVSAQLIQSINQDLTINYDFGYVEDESVTPAFFSDITTERFSAGINASFEHSAHTTIVAGVDYYDDQVETLSDFTETSRDNLGFFAQALYNRGAISSIASLRYDDNEAYGDEVTTTLALGYDLTSDLEVILSYGTSFRAPTFNDLFFPGFSNPDLNPEQGESIELSFQYHYENLNARISLYQTDIEDLIAFDFATFLPMNVSEASLEGVEIELSTQAFDWLFSANLDYLDAIDETANSRLTDRARVTANLSAQKQFNALNLLIDWQAETGRIDGGNRIGGYGILGVSANYIFNEKLSLNVRVDNLFDRDYVLNLASGLANPFQTEGRIGKASLNYRF